MFFALARARVAQLFKLRDGRSFVLIGSRTFLGTALSLGFVLQRTPGDTSEPSEAPVRCNAALGEEAANRIC